LYITVQKKQDINNKHKASNFLTYRPLPVSGLLHYTYNITSCDYDLKESVLYF